MVQDGLRDFEPDAELLQIGRDVRRKSCKCQSFTPEASSSLRFGLSQPWKTPRSPGKTNAEPTYRGAALMIA
jgi:hypothetical protein